MVTRNGTPKNSTIGVHAVLVVPYPISTGKDFIYIREPQSKLYRLPYIHIESIEALPKPKTELTMRGLDARARIGSLIGVYTFKGETTDLVTFAFAGRCLDSVFRVADESSIGGVRQFSLESLDHVCEFYGSNYSTQPVRDFVSKLSISDDRILRFC